MTFEEFLKSRSRNAWIDYGPLSIYVRKGIHSIGKEYKDTFDLANMHISDDRKKRQGTFTKFLEMVEENVDVPVYVENILNEWMIDFLIERGYNIVDIGGVKSAIRVK